MNMNRLIFSGGFFVGSVWGAGLCVLLPERKKREKQIEVSGDGLQTEQTILKYGAPAQSPVVMYYRNHVLNYDQEKKIPRWVAEDITADHLKGDANRRHSKFRSDPNIPEKFRSLNSDFWKSGWSRGHMAPAGDYKFDQGAMDDTFLLSNVLPQDINNNGGFWNRFEIYCRDLTQKYGHVRIISGPVMVPSVEENGKQFVKYEVVGQTQVAVPTHLYKVVLAEGNTDSDVPLLATFIVPNEAIDYSHKLTEYQVPLDELEKRTGLTFHPKIDRSKTKNLCTVDGCKLMERDQFELYFMCRRMQSAQTLEKLEKVWSELETKKLQPDAYTKELYTNKKTEILKKIDSFKYK